MFDSEFISQSYYTCYSVMFFFILLFKIVINDIMLN